MTTIAFIGLGNMGLPMAQNLAKSGFVLKGYDLSADSCSAAKAAGLGIAASAQAAVAEADVVLTMLPAGRHVLAVWSDVLPHARAGAIFIDSSTIDVESSQTAHYLASQRGIDALDGPVSGGVGGAQAGTLTFMVGGTEAAYMKGTPILESMGRRIVHCGAAGAGQAAKICNNMITGITMIAVSEAFTLAEKLGLSHQSLFDVASASSGQCWALTSYCPVPGPVPASPANANYKPGFSAALMLKDLQLAQQAALGSGATTLMGAEAARLYDLYVSAGHSDDDFSGVINFLRTL